MSSVIDDECLGEACAVGDTELESYRSDSEREDDMLLLDAYYEMLAHKTVALSTSRRYREALTRLAKAGIRTTDDATRERVGEVQKAMLGRGMTRRSVSSEFCSLRSVLTFLEGEDRFPLASLVAVRKTVIRCERINRRRRVRFLAPDELEELARSAARVVPRLELPIRVAALAGSRVGELARMRAEDRNERSFQIVTLSEFGEAGACKTGPRVVPICRELEDLFRERLPRSGWLFPSGGSWPNGAQRGPTPKIPFLSRCLLEDGIKRARRAARLPDDITFTVLRHTRASWWLQGGASLYKVADWLGHDFATCEAYYGSLVDGYDADCERMPA